MDLDEILLTAEEAMDKAVDYLRSELKGVRTGRASPGLVEFIKVEYYGSPTDLRQLALISTPEPTQILIKPFDASSLGDIRKAIEAAGLGLNPQVEGKQIRLNLPSLTGERRQHYESTQNSAAPACTAGLSWSVTSCASSTWWPANPGRGTPA